jgi:hypothetical protein
MGAGMITQNMVIQLVNSPKEAPNYPEDWTPLAISKAIVVGRGTVAGRPTVDLQLVDGQGNEYVVMTTGALMELLADAIEGKRKACGN